LFTEPQTELYKTFVSQFAGESDRGAILIAGVFLDELLKKVIDAHLVQGSKMTEDRNPLSQFAARINMVYGLGLISKRDFDDLDAIRKVRNGCAHKITFASFQAEEISRFCDQLAVVKEIQDSNVGDLAGFQGARQRFLWSVAVIHQHLVTILNSRPKKPLVPRSKAVRFIRPEEPAIPELLLLEGDELPSTDTFEIIALA